MSDDFDAELANTAEGLDDESLLQDLKDFIVAAERERPRSLQRIPGPSEVAHPCHRHLAYKINASRSDEHGISGDNVFKDPLAAIIGTATHSWLEEAAHKANTRLGRMRWITETRVVVREKDGDREELAGTCDLYDVDTGTVIDWKVPGPTQMKTYTEKGPHEVYRGQAHLYGHGYKKLGMPVNTVAICFVPRTGNMRGMHLWREPYNEELVEEILSRLDHTEELMAHHDVVNHPTGFLRIPITPTKLCRYCPWFSPKPETAWQCGGKEELR